MSVSASSSVLDWLRAGDPSVAWQTERDLLGLPAKTFEATRARVAKEGFGARLLSQRATDGTWGGGIYTPKYTSTFYTLQLLAHLGLPERNSAAVASCRMLLDLGIQRDGQIRLWPEGHSDTCIGAMLVSIVLAFGFAADRRMPSAIDWLLREQMDDGGWNCRRRRGATHSSFPTTTSVLEAFAAWQARNGRLRAVAEAAERGRQFLLAHHLYRSHRTGEIADPAFTRLTFPMWWRFDLLRGLDHFRMVAAPWHQNLEDPLKQVTNKRSADGTWTLHTRPVGKSWFSLERLEQPSRFLSLRALRVLRWADKARARSPR